LICPASDSEQLFIAAHSRKPASVMATTRSFMVLFVLVAQIAFATSDTDQGIDTKIADTMRALDTNGNGKVDKAEIAVFAKSQGLSTQEVLADFQELDVNKDGELDSTEIGGLLGEAQPEDPQLQAAAKFVAPSAQQSQLAASAAVPAPALRAQKTKVAKAKAGKVEDEPQQPIGAMGLDLVALEKDTQQQAGNVMAGRLAQRAQVLLARSSADEKKAERFDAEVRNLRANATSLASEVNKDTRKAARDTVSAVAQKSLAQLKKLQQQQKQAEGDAADHRQQAKKAMERVRQAQASLHDAGAF